VVTNIDADHLENYGGDFNRVKGGVLRIPARCRSTAGRAVRRRSGSGVARRIDATGTVVLRLRRAADVRASDVQQLGGAMRFTCTCRNRRR
jgi:UDP-N-acetylmuramate--alanine ligase